ncbi:hypothetical protein Tco_0751405 [Tanacetum coccineum]|uniref:Uncharacterized protein n=1 Tax=Tanacetum coccineum TaxID=301880 RepID=A0ABQ4Z3Z4_9ASTR
MTTNSIRNADHAGCQDTRQKSSAVPQALPENDLISSRISTLVTWYEEYVSRNPYTSSGRRSGVKDGPPTSYATRYPIANIMANVNILVNDAPVEQASAVAPSTRTDDQILSLSKTFTASSTIPAIYIQQFWDTMCFDSSTGLYSCQSDEKWFNLHKDEAGGVQLNAEQSYWKDDTDDEVLMIRNWKHIICIRHKWQTDQETLGAAKHKIGISTLTNFVEKFSGNGEVRK